MGLEKKFFKKARNFVAALALSTFLYSCPHPNSPSSVSSVNNSNTQENSSSQTYYDPPTEIKTIVSEGVSASSGASIKVTELTSFIPDTELVIPPGALKSDTAISIGRVDNPPTLPVGLNYVGAPIDLEESNNLTFNSPLTIKLHYSEESLSDAGLSDDSNLEVYSYDKLTDNWTKVNLISVDTTNHIISAEINHFSYYAITGGIGSAPEDLGIPQPGDLLYTLGFVGDGWTPGHVGIYTGEKKYPGTGLASDDVKKFGLYNVVEALWDGVQYSYYDIPNVQEKFESSLSKFSGIFTYMGAREPKNYNLTSQQRSEIVNYVEAQIGKPYAWAQTVGVLYGALKGSLVKGPDSFNCVGLAEKAYEVAGVNNGEGLVTANNEESAESNGISATLTPAEQYNATQPAKGSAKLPIVSFVNVNETRQDSQIEIIDENGFNENQITFDSSEKNYPRFSPNRDKIIFESRALDNFRNNIATLYTIDIDGSNLTQLIGSSECTQPAWSSKNEIAFIPEYGMTNIYLSDFSFLNKTKLTSTYYVEETPSFSPDGNYVIYNSNHRDIIKIDLLSKIKSVLIPGSFGIDNSEPEFSPDGNKIVFSSNRNEKNNWDIYLYDINSKNILRLTQVSSVEYSPHFSRDGSKIFFASDKDGTYQIYSINLDGSGWEQITHGPKNHDFGYWDY